MPSRALPALLAVLLTGTAAAPLAAAQDDGTIGPQQRLLNNGRRLTPFGLQIKLGQFPTGGALTPNGRWYWTVSTGRGENDVRIVSVRSGRVLQTLRLPGASGGIAMDPSSNRVYVSGVADSEGRPLQQTPEGTPGRKGDVIHVFSYNGGTGSARAEGIIPVPPPSDAQAPQNFPPKPTVRASWPDRLAVSPDGDRLLVPLNLADAAAIVDVKSKGVRYVNTGNYPYGAAILPDGKRGLVSNETPGSVSVIDLDRGRKIKDIIVGGHLSHPEAIAVDPRGDRAYVAVTNIDQVAVIDLDKLAVEKTLSVARPDGSGAAPVDVEVSPDGDRLLVAEAGTDSIAVFGLPGRRTRAQRARRDGERVLRGVVADAVARAGGRGKDEEEAGRDKPLLRQSGDSDFPLLGHIPTGQYPTDVEVAGASARNPCGTRAGKRRGRKVKRCTKLLYVSAKGLGTGPNPQGPRPDTPEDSDAGINKTQYLPLLNLGTAGVSDFPSAKRLAQLTRTARATITPTNAQAAPADTVLKPNGPIKYVFYIVRENRTYDQILGDDPRGDGDPSLALFGERITPNAHAIARRFPLLDHVYANSEASIDGHFWTSAAKVSDYVNKNWFQNYANRGRPYDFGVYSVTWPANGFLFDQAERQGISYFNYGEAIAGTLPLTDKDRLRPETQEVIRKFTKSDLGELGPLPLVSGVTPGAGCYASDASIHDDAVTGQPVFDSVVPPGAGRGASSRYSCFEQRFTQQLLTGSVPSFNYMVATNDHTVTLSAGKRTPRAMVADNDEFLGRVVDLISNSSIWKQSAIFVVEDDSQDGADHVDAHRIPAYVISPYAKRGAVVRTRYDFLSVIRSMELILGMKPLGLFDQLATPMYDAFGPTPENSEPLSYTPAKVDLLEKNPSGTPGARAAARLPSCLDCASQRDMDRLLWKSVYGWSAEPPPPGPNAEGVDPERLDQGDG